MKYYSQFGEDVKVAELLTVNGVLPKGLILEIGAWHHTLLSNSRAFIEDGWDAVLVEMSPTAVSTLVREYGYNDRVQVIQAAITPGPEKVKQFEISEDALSTSEQGNMDVWRKIAGYYGRLWVQSLSVDALMDQFFAGRLIDVASIDAEGTSPGVAVALMESEHRPRVLVVEFDNKLEYLQTIARQWGYETRGVTDANLILIR